MKKFNYVLITLFFGSLAISVAQPKNATSQTQLADTLNIGYQVNALTKLMSYSVSGVNASAFENSPSIDISKSLYGKIAGLNVYQGTGSSPDNVPLLSLHGHTPLVLVDGFPRDISDVTALEVESVYVLKDAAAAALYGMRGANGVVMIKTKRGTNDDLKITTSYNFGINTQFRSPLFVDASTYAQALNGALVGDGLPEQYNALELDAFRTGRYPYDYPNVDWWNQALNKSAYNHNLKMSFNGGNEKFRYFTVFDYYRDESLLKSNEEDKRYDTKPTDTRLSLRTNLDVDLSSSTYMKIGLLGKLQELNGTRYGRSNIFNPLYNTPSLAFPLRYENGIYGGGSVYGANNPIALLKDFGHVRNIYGTLLADLSIRQKLDVLTEGLSAEVSAAFDNIGGMQESSSKEYRYMNSYANIIDDGTLVTTPIIYGKDSETLGHNQGFERLMMRSNFQTKIAYDRTFGKHQIQGAVIHDMQSVIRNGRNNSRKNQTTIFNPTYTFDNRYTINGVFSYAGSAYLSDGDKFDFYPSLSAGWILSNESFLKDVTFINHLKLRTSYGFSGWDGNLSHELWRQAYGGSGTSYNFGENAAEVWGASEGNLPVVGLVAERSEKATVGLDFEGINNQLSVSIEGFYENRSDMLVTGASSTSGIIGVSVGQVNEGVSKYRGLDVSLNWKSGIGDFQYNLGTNMSYLNSEMVNDNQAYQQYDYLYRRGNRVGQMYGLEAIGFFNNQQEINNSPLQTFSDVSPGDVKYKDQNGDNRIDEKDRVRMFGSSIPQFYFGFNVNLSYKKFDLYADFQGMAGKTVSLLNSPLYKPLTGGKNLSTTFLDEEIHWTPENQADATMPRLTTLENSNNYQASSLWYRDGSFIKLRNLSVAYTFSKSQTRFANLKIFAQAANLFSLDNIGFADPEQLGIAYPSIKSYQLGMKLNF